MNSLFDATPLLLISVTWADSILVIARTASSVSYDTRQRQGRGMDRLASHHRDNQIKVMVNGDAKREGNGNEFTYILSSTIHHAEVPLNTKG